jgi:hypothetical protein
MKSGAAVPKCSLALDVVQGGEMKLKLAAAVCSALFLAGSGVAAKAKGSQAAESPLVRALAACRSQTDDTARLRCYDAAAGALTEAATSGKVVVVDQEDVRKTRRSLFGFSLPKLPFFSGDDSADEQQDELTGKIASAGPLGYGKYRIKLEDGALWETTEGVSTIRDPKRGDTVVIKRGPLGSYMIRIAGQRGLRAKRVG